MESLTADTGAATLASWVEDAAQRMDDAGLHFGHGTAAAFDEACWMASRVLSLRPDFGDEAFGRRLDGDELGALERLLARRIETRKPLAYLVGEAWFAGLRFEVDERVLVPRSPLGELIVEGLAPWMDLDAPRRVLDVGTGSGCIAVALAVHWPMLTVDAIDVSEAALASAAANASLHGVQDRVSVFGSDVYDGLPERDGNPATYDLIVANPPYVPEASMASLPVEYGHEPAGALRAGADGLDVVRRVLSGAADRLRPGGLLLLEVGEVQPQTERLLGDVEALWMAFEHGGEGVVLLERNALAAWRERGA